jgi:glycosyltransferase involved in cell wall biosynthesis
VPNRPTAKRIDQVIPTIVMRDAVSNHTFEAQRVLRGLGFDSEIYAQNIGVEVKSRVRPLRDLDPSPTDGRWLLYQASIGSPVADAFAACEGPKLLNYHNITPVELIGWWEPYLAGELELGRQQLGALAPLTKLAIAVSSYNEAELVAAGYASTAVAPFLGDFAATAPPDPSVSARLAREDAAGGANWLFVGQIAPHKAQHDVIKALAFYRAAYDRVARLRIIGRESSPRYTAALRQLVRKLGLESAVLFEGSVSEAAKTSYFRHADVFVGCSEHEGFCAPLIEAMHDELPIVAYGAAAVPETLGGAGIVLPTKEPSLVAAAVHRVVTDSRLRARLVRRGRERASEFSIEAARTRFAKAVTETVDAP